MADVKRFNSKNGIENGTQESNLSMSDILISQHITGDNNDYKLTLAQAQAIPYGVCESLGGEDKTANLVNYPTTFIAQIGNTVLIKFTHGNTKGSVSEGTYPTLTVGGITKPIAAQGKTIGAGAITDGQIVSLTLTPDYWNIDQTIRDVTSEYTVFTDGTTIYTKAQTDNTINTKLESYPTSEEVNTKFENYDDKGEVDSKINGALADYATKEELATKGTVSSVSVKMNGTTKGTVTTSGEIDLGTVLTSHQSLSGYLKESAKSIGQSGYLKLTNGLIIQWGFDSFDSTRNTTRTITMPISFSNNSSYVTLLTPYSTSKNSAGSSTVRVAGNQFTYIVFGIANTDRFHGVSWFAIGV